MEIPRCLISSFDGVTLSLTWKQAGAGSRGLVRTRSRLSQRLMLCTRHMIPHHLCAPRLLEQQSDGQLCELSRRSLRLQLVAS